MCSRQTFLSNEKSVKMLEFAASLWYVLLWQLTMRQCRQWIVSWDLKSPIFFPSTLFRYFFIYILWSTFSLVLPFYIKFETKLEKRYRFFLRLLIHPFFPATKVPFHFIKHLLLTLLVLVFSLSVSFRWKIVHGSWVLHYCFSYSVIPRRRYSFTRYYILFF